MARLTLILGVLATVVYLLDGFRFMLNEWRNWRNKGKWLVGLALCLVPSPALATLWYVDSACIPTPCGSANGTSWANAWATRAAITGIAAGDTVYFSGGTSGKSYDSAADWQPTNGSAGGGPVTFAVGQDAGHTGMVTFVATGVFAGAYAFVTADSRSYITFNGEVNGERRMTISGYSHTCYTQNENDRHMKFLYFITVDAIFNCRGAYMEIGHADVRMIGDAGFAAGDHSMFLYTGAGTTAPAYGQSSFHHNIIRMPRAELGYLGGSHTDADGWDGLKSIRGVDVYNNTFLAVNDVTYTGFQHNDGLQGDLQYVRIYNNYFENITNYSVFSELFGSSCCIRVYNNVFKSEEPGQDWTAQHAVAIGFSGGALPNVYTVSDMIIANNTVLSPGSGHGIRFNTGTVGTIGSDVYIVNNIVYNNAVDPVLWNGPGTLTLSNTASGTANLSFVNDSLYPTNDFHLTAAATAAINQGITPPPSYLTNLFTTDAGGVARADVWDIGAYEFGSGTAASPVVIARVLRWMEVAAFVTGMGWHFRKPLMAMCLAALSLGGTLVQLAPKSYDTVKVVSRDSAVKVLTAFNHLTKPRA